MTGSAAPNLITGALGQDGFILCRRLRELNEPVVALARPGSAERGEWHALLSRGCQLIEAELTDAGAVASVVGATRPARIFHLAAAHHSAESGAETSALWEEMLRTNLLCTAALARAAIEHRLDPAFVFASSSQIWSARVPEDRVDETTPVAPATFYGHTKVWAAEFLRQCAHGFGLRAAVAILFNHESPRRAASFVTRKISMAAARASMGDRSTLRLRNIGARVDWQAASDVIEALILMGQPGATGEFVLASGTLHSVADFAELAYGHAGLKWRDYVRWELDETGAALVGSSARAVRELGWRPRVSFPELVASMVDADIARLGGREPQ